MVGPISGFRTLRAENLNATWFASTQFVDAMPDPVLLIILITHKFRVPLDESEGSIKGVGFLGDAQAPPVSSCQRRLRTKTLEISR